jgi:aspartyl-tRNA(Asn)/glutamyl-tRNA(Gln) amidotransferase subunit A
MTATAREALEICLDHVRHHDEAVNAFITVTEDAAREQAQRADHAAAEGQWLGLLHGMPIAVKDNIATAGTRTTSGSLLYKDYVPNHDAEAMRRIRAAGAVMVGKVTMHELAFGVRSDNPIIGACHNPWDLDRIPGGSSGGSGAALAADMCIGALGSDTGGSVRLPGAINGVTALRPTHGRISNHGVTPVSVRFDTVGPMARRVEDVARIFAVLAGYDPKDPLSVDRPLENFLPTLGDGVAGLRIGVPENFFYDDLHPDVAAAVAEAAKTFERLGASLHKVTVAGAESAHRWAATMIYSDLCAHFGDVIENQPEMISPGVLERMKTGFAHTGTDYARGMRAQEIWKRTLADVFTGVDMILTPTMPGEPALIQDSRKLLDATHDATKFTYGAGLSGTPAISLPCGLTANNLPIGVMLEGPWWSEPALLRAGAAYQRETDWHLRKAPILFS